MAFVSKKYPFNVVFRRLRANKVDDDGKPVVNKNGESVLLPTKFDFKVGVPVGTLADYQGHWKREGLNPDTTLIGLLNQAEKQSKEGFKALVREAVLDIESELYKPSLTHAQLVTACRKDPRVVKALEDMQANVTANHIGQPRNRDVTKTLAAKVGVALLKQDAPRLKALAAELGIDLPTS